MAYDREVFSRCQAVLRARRQHAQDAASERRAQLCLTYPEFAEMDRALRDTGRRIFAVMQAGQNVEEEMEKLRQRNLQLQADRAAFLSAKGLPGNYLEPQYHCAVCGDEGYIDGAMCACLRDLLAEETCKKLNESSPLALSSFEDFSLSYYPDQPGPGGVNPRQHMTSVVRYLQSYARDFSPQSPNLYFYGATGLGKTHLSLAIANAVIHKGFHVIYGSAQNLFTAVADERFDRAQGGDTEENLLSCDLLILDDLGAEHTTQFSQSIFYNILNTRLLAHRPMIFNSNIDLAALDQTYHQRIASRIAYEFKIVPFIGRDIRQLRKKQDASS